MGLLDATCSDIFFPLECDIYYAKEEQDKYGAVNRKWFFDSSQVCSFHSIGDESTAGNLSFNDNKFYSLESTIYGRIKNDIRVASDGLYYPQSHILITNIRGGSCDPKTPYFIETNGNYAGKPTVFELKMIQPYIGPFGNIEYYKAQLERSDYQELNDVAAC